MSNTYEAIFTATASGSTSFVTISSIPATYTDLVLVAQYMTTANGGLFLQYNNDNASTNYSVVNMIGVTGGTASYSDANEPYIWADTYYMGTGTVTTDRPIVKAHIMNYANTSMFKTTLLRSDDVRTTGTPNDGTVYAGVGTWRSTSAITRIDVLSGNGNFVAGSTFSLYGIKAETIPTPTKATGGEIFADANYVYHAFGSSGTFTPTQSISADVLCIAGGGGAGVGGAGVGGAGGGAGGLTYYASQSLTATNYTVTVGGGGAGGTASATSINGNNSQFASLTASVGGGRGGQGGAYSGLASGGNGGSGGGAAYISAGNRGSIGTGTSGQGNNGGASYAAASSDGSGGGGGFGAVGETSGASNSGAGGIGTNTYSTWATVTGTGVSGYYAGGGGGGGRSGSATAAAGGTGGGGSGQVNTFGNSGTVSTGGGGGGGGTGTGANNYSGGSGGSGLVIVRYTI